MRLGTDGTSCLQARAIRAIVSYALGLLKCPLPVSRSAFHLARSAVTCHLVNAWLNDEAEMPMKPGIWIDMVTQHHIAFNATKPKGLKGKRLKG